MAVPMLVLLSGLPGAGKSALGAELGKRRGVAVLSVDPVESAMAEAGVAASFERGLAAYRVVETIAEAELAAGRSVIADAVNAEPAAKEMWRELARRRGAEMRIVECVCSDEALHRARLEARRRGLAAGFAEPTWEDVVRRREAWVPWREGEAVLRIDAVAELGANVATVMAWLDRPFH